MQNDIQNKLKNAIAEINAKNKETIVTEEEVKQALVLPFFKALGYESDKTEILKPEFISDIDSKTGEKVDFAILEKGKPLLLIEAKKLKIPLMNNRAQLSRYSHACVDENKICPLSVLTNGIEYLFFSDVEINNRMDKKPFLHIKLEDFKESDYEKLCLFAKDFLTRKNLTKIKEKAKKYFYENAVENFFQEQIKRPNDKFVEFIAAQITDNKKTENLKNEFRGYIKKYFENAFADKPQEIPQKLQESTSKPNADTLQQKALEFVKEICAGKIDNPNRFNTNRTGTYINVLLDTDKWICRCYFSTSKDREEKEFPFRLINVPMDFFPNEKDNGTSEFPIRVTGKSAEEAKKECKDYILQTLKERLENKK